MGERGDGFHRPACRHHRRLDRHRPRHGGADRQPGRQAHPDRAAQACAGRGRRGDRPGGPRHSLRCRRQARAARCAGRWHRKAWPDRRAVPECRRARRFRTDQRLFRRGLRAVPAGQRLVPLLGAAPRPPGDGGAGQGRGADHRHARRGARHGGEHGLLRLQTRDAGPGAHRGDGSGGQRRALQLHPPRLHRHADDERRPAPCRGGDGGDARRRAGSAGPKKRLRWRPSCCRTTPAM